MIYNQIISKLVQYVYNKFGNHFIVYYICCGNNEERSARDTPFLVVRTSPKVNDTLC